MKKIPSLIWELFEVVLIAFLPLFIISQFIARPFIVQGASMEPNFQDGNYLIIDMVSYKFNDPERGDAVVFRYPGNRSLFYIKRVIGLPGDHVALRNGDVFVNNKIIEEKYSSLDIDTIAYNQIDFSLTKDQFFVMGDNRAMSFDSRSWGPLERSDIIGFVRLRLWPLSGLEFFRNSN